MKYLFLALILMLSCKKERKDRNIEIIAYYYDCEVDLSNEYRSRFGIQKGKRYNFIAHGYTHSYGAVTSKTKDTLNEGFRLVLICDGNCVYDEMGSQHTFKF